MTFTYKELIDVAIGSPESGHVNFYALHVLLTCFGQRLDVLDEVVEQEDYMTSNVRLQSSMLTLAKSSKFRMFAGADAEEAPAAEPVAEASVEQAPEVAPEEAPEEAPEPPAEDSAAPEVAEASPEPEPEAEAPAEPVPAQEEPPAAEPEAEMQPEPEPEPAAQPEPEAQPEAQPEPAAVSPAAKSPAAVSPARSLQAQRSEHATRTISAENLDTKSEKKSNETLTHISHVSSTRGDSSLVSNVMRLEKRVSKMELQKELATNELQSFVNSITGQLKITMDQVNNVTHLLIDRKPNPQRIKNLRNIAKQLRVLMATTADEVSVSWTSEEIAGEDEGDVLAEEEVKETSTEISSEKPEEDKDMGLEPPVCYASDRLLTELLELKSQFCEMSNKMNDFAAALLKQDSQKVMDMIKELQDSVRDIRLSIASGRETTNSVASRVTDALSQIATLRVFVDHMNVVKSDKAERELLLAGKVNFAQLATKVSLEQMEEYKARIEKLFCEVRHIINLNEKNVLQIIDNLRNTMGIDSLELSLKDFREILEKRVHTIAEALQKYMEMTNDDCAAAAGRVKVLPDLSCLSCDTTCVMRSVERSKVPSLPNAKGSSSLAPIVTYELGQIRKSGIMGYYRKDEFPTSTSAWTKGTGVPMVKCTVRHAGGSHTTHTANEHMQKVVLSKKNTGWK
ncbi:uncharacterized protein nis [Drosophila kikkawai]|uniref:Uncharacterized protein nis n=1 Tax=Drosophila kikkawai TaxID=30033 RepID=A0A6P4ISY5_DROKI|nr:uncharacterized protein LOC108081398 [Drosophila kikkawai]